MTIIEKAKDLSKLSMKELIGFLTTHDIKVKDFLDDDDAKKKKLIALKDSTSHESERSDQNSDEDDNSDFILITKKFKKILSRRKKKSFIKKSFKNEKEDQTKKEPIMCYKYRKSGHIKYDCSLLKKKKNGRWNRR